MLELNIYHRSKSKPLICAAIQCLQALISDYTAIILVFMSKCCRIFKKNGHKNH